MISDPYKVLGVSPDASDEEIQKAYRRLVKKYHPDVNPGDESAEKKMREINAAYDQIRNIREGKASGGQSYGGGNGGYGDFGGYGGGGFNSPAGQGFATRTDIDAALATQGIENGIQNISTQLCNGFAGVNSAIANLGYQNQQCLNRFAKAIANLFTKNVNTVGTYA